MVDDLKTLLAIVCAGGALLMLYVALTAPMIAMTGPAILTVGLGAAAVFAWKSRTGRAPRAQPPAEKTIRLGGRDLKDHRH